MAGPFDNESGLYMAQDNWENGHWYSGEDGALYIVPVGEDDISGPEDEVYEALLALYYGKEVGEVDAYEVAEKLDLDVIPAVLKRFDPEAGYFHA